MATTSSPFALLFIGECFHCNGNLYQKTSKTRAIMLSGPAVVPSRSFYFKASEYVAPILYWKAAKTLAKAMKTNKIAKDAK